MIPTTISFASGVSAATNSLLQAEQEVRVARQTLERCGKLRPLVFRP
jgi:hypothetical protein